MFDYNEWDFHECYTGIKRLLQTEKIVRAAKDHTKTRKKALDAMLLKTNPLND